MKKRIAFRKLSRTPSHKFAMLRNMATSLIEHERIVTTVPKAKELRHLAEHLITLSKKGNIYQRQQANAIVRTKPALTKLFEILGPRYQHRQGGYTRILKLAKPRKGDNADMCIMEYVDRPGELRAARPPTVKQVDVLSDMLRDVGITPLKDMEKQAGVIEGVQVNESVNSPDHTVKMEDLEADEIAAYEKEKTHQESAPEQENPRTK